MHLVAEPINTLVRARSGEIVVVSMDSGMPLHSLDNL